MNNAAGEVRTPDQDTSSIKDVAETASAAAAGATSRYRWYVLAVLYLIYVCNVGDRLLLSILAQDIKTDLRLSDWEIGLLIGPAIAIVYAILGVPMAYVADRVNRVCFLALCVSIWSVLTAMGGAASNALMLGLARIGVSAVEAGGGPTSSSIIADYFAPRQRPTAMGIYASAAMVGVLLSFGIGGLLNAHLGWRWTLVAAGIPGVLLALLLLATVREPRRGVQERDAHGNPLPTADPRSLAAGVGALLRNRLFGRVALATGVANFCANLIINWGPSLVIRKFYAGTQHTGLSLGFGMALFGGGGAIVAGRIISRLSDKGLGRPLKMTGLLQLLAGPTMLAALFMPRIELCIALMCLAYGLQSFFVPMYWSVAQSEVPAELRAMAAALMLLAAAFLGTGLSGPLIGALSDALRPAYGEASLQMALAIGTVSSLLSGVLFWRSARSASRA
jgi:predicted MFS family arabinose efflux permease